MIDVLIVCAHEAIKIGSVIRRLLNAEGFAAEIVHGRGSVAMIEEACQRRVAILLIWSIDAPSTDYMHKWAAAADPVKLAEVARAPIWPPLEGRRARVIDFSEWGGERGSPAWQELEDRLRHIARATEPKRTPSIGPALILAGAGALLVGGGVVARLQQSDTIVATAQFQEPQMIEARADDGLGGPLNVVEPASYDGDEDVAYVRRIRGAVRMIEPTVMGPLTDVETVDAKSYRDANLLDRLTGWTAPLVNAVERPNQN